MRFYFALTAFASTILFSNNAFAQEAEEDDDVRPSPPSIGADVPVTYFGPAPSTVQRELIGPLQLLNSGTVDQDAGTTTIPLYQGRVVRGNIRNVIEGESIWHILTDTTDEGAAKALGLNHSPKLRFANVGNGARWSTLGASNTLTFTTDSYVDFTPERVVIPGAAPNYFPPQEGTGPGAVGNPRYSPIIYVNNIAESYNAPVVASREATPEMLNQYCNGLPTDAAGLAAARRILHDRVVAICPEENTVTLELVPGHSFARPVLYLSTEASDPVSAALEAATYAPGMGDIPVGADDSFGSAIERLFAVTNGFTNGDLAAGASVANHPGRNGLNSALRGDGPPLNVLGGIPTIATDYSPLWDVNVGSWTDEAVRDGYRTRWLEEFQILGFVERGLVTGPNGTPFGSAGFIVNCPIVFRFL